MSRLISFVSADSSCKRELEIEKILDHNGTRTTLSRVLDWRSIRLCYRVVLTEDI